MFSDPASDFDRQFSSSSLMESPYGATLETKKRRKEFLSGNPEKTPCIKCGRVPHRRCENNLCPRCCNVVVKNCPIHIKKNEPRRGNTSSKSLDNPRNLTEANEVYRTELESLRKRYRWIYERKILADEKELQQSIKRYKENATWLSEIINSHIPELTKMDKDENSWELQQQELLKACDEFLQTDMALNQDSKTPTRDEVTSKSRRTKKKGKRGSGATPSVQSHDWITSVVLPESEWKPLIDKLSSKSSQTL